VVLILLARRLLYPLDDLAAAARSIEPSALHFNPPASAVQTKELAPLTRVLRQVVDRLRSAYACSHRDRRNEIVISNLVMNAIQHSAEGSPVRVAARAIGAGILVMVQDFGSGISADSLPHVFDRFFREDASRSRETGGAGLGLSICKAIVEKAGGGIEIESQKGRGTIVKIRLPRSRTSVQNNPLQS
jgi:C4-dicarboxylate-specific signal transduction histidine kinase